MSPEIVRVGVDEAVIYKPAGLSSERPPHGRVPALLDWVQRALSWPEARLPHRLDRPTRGLLVLSRDARAAARHGEEIRQGMWAKWYVARIERPRLELLGMHRAYLRRDGAVATIVRAGGDPSRLEVLGVVDCLDGSGHAQLLIRLWTGRFHQIRAMLAHLGSPLVGDTAYGSRVSLPKSHRIVQSRAGNRETSTDDAWPRIDLESVALVRPRDGVMCADRRTIDSPASPQIEKLLDDAIAMAMSTARTDGSPL
jgi:23S rRNA pseudouridine1911/1915/1917 synthase